VTPAEVAALTPSTLRLPDGRTLAWYDLGDRQGAPLLYTTGTPSSGLGGAIYDDAARRAGVRLISVDKPGYGHSTFDPQRSLLRYAEDVRVLADHLGLRRFAVAGESGGGPHVLAKAYALPDRVTVAIVLAGMGPGSEAWVREGMKPMNKRLFWMAQHTPWLLRLALTGMARSFSTEERRNAFAAKQLKVQPEADNRLLETHPELLELVGYGAAGAFREGSRGAAQELAVFARPWGFGIEDIRCHVELWHGTEDVNVPVAVAREVVRRLPDCTAHIVDGAGHALALEHVDAILATVVDAAVPS
jgi:pimeloyl-ACP methyl ester carboxylesterase